MKKGIKSKFSLLLFFGEIAEDSAWKKTRYFKKEREENIIFFEAGGERKYRETGRMVKDYELVKWSKTISLPNGRRPRACRVVRAPGFELGTSCESSRRSSQLSYARIISFWHSVRIVCIFKKKTRKSIENKPDL